MAATLLPNTSKIAQRLNKESESGFSIFTTRTYRAGPESTLTSLGLNVGDDMPTMTGVEIVESSIQHDGKTDQRYAIATGVQEQVADTGSPWSELVMTRRVSNTVRTKSWQITFTGSTTAVRPARRQTYQQVTGLGVFLYEDGLVTEPEVVSVLDVKQATRNKTHVTVVFSARWRVTV